MLCILLGSVLAVCTKKPVCPFRVLLIRPRGFRPISPGEDRCFLIPEVELGRGILLGPNLSFSYLVPFPLCHICGLALLAVIAAIVGLEWEKIVR